MSSRILDLRPGRNNRAPVSGQQPLRLPPQKPGAPRRQKPLRQRRRRTRLILAFIALVLIACAAWEVSAVSYLPRYSVQRIVVTGTENVPPELVQAYVLTLIDDGSHHFISRGNIFNVPAKVIERDIVLDFPRIASANVSRNSLFSTTLDVAVTERQPFALWCESDPAACYEMDNGGFIFEAAPAASSSSQYVFYGGLASSSSSSIAAIANPIGQTFVPAHLPGIIALLTNLGQAGFTPLGATVSDSADFTVPLAEGFSVKASFGEDPDVLVNDLQLVLSSAALQGKESDLQYVDLRFGDHVYYKLIGQAEASSTPH